MQVIEVQHKHNVQNTQVIIYFFLLPLVIRRQIQTFATKENADEKQRIKAKKKKKQHEKDIYQGWEQKWNKQQIKLSALSIKNL